MDEATSSRFWLESNRLLVALVLLAAVLFCLTNLPWHLDDFSQERQALASFDMVKEGRWLYQQAPREREATKPPALPWISAGIYGVTRSWDVAWRLPSLAAAAALCVLLFRAARDRFGRAAAVLGFSAFAFNMLSARLATLVRTDMPLAFVVFLIGALIWRKIETGEPWTSRDRWRLFALLTLSAFMKGPIAYVFLLPAIAAYQWRWRSTPQANAWSGWWPWLASVGVFIVWVIGGLLTQPGFYDQVILHEFLGRFNTAEQRPHPPYYYVGHLLHKFAPWSELLLLAAIFDWRNTGAGTWREKFSRLPPGVFWLLCWSLCGLVIMSIVPSKRLDRIYPLIAPMCLLVAAQAAALEKMGKRLLLSRWAALGLTAAFLLTGQYAVSKVYDGYRHHRDALSLFGREVRRQAAQHHWRFEAVESHDGGMLLYLEKTHFVQPDEAASKWNGGEIDSLVVRKNDAGDLLPKLSGATVSPIRSDQFGEHPNVYLLITR